MKETVQLSEEKVDLLKHIELTQRDDLKYHRDFQYKIFVWSGNILLILIGALLITKPTENIVWTIYGFLGRLTASLTVIAIVIFSVKWQNRHRKWHQENRQVISKIDILLHCYEKGYFASSEEISLFPERWNDSSEMEDISIFKRIRNVNYISATMFLGLLAVVMIWVS
jgi:hypothetical protein